MSKRSPYTMRELKDIVNYIVHHNAYAETKARLMWQKCAATNITNRTWQSLKETFLKRILTDIANPYYKLTQEQIDSFRSGSNLHSRVHNKLEWCTSDGEAGPSNKIKNNFNVKNKKTQDGDDELMALTLEQGELADSHVCRDRREDSNSRDTLKLYSNDEGNQKENKDEINSDKTLVLDENDDTGTINCSRESGSSSKLKDKLIFLEPLTPMMQEMITDSDICNSSDSTEVIQENEDIKEIDGSSKENKENETMENIDVIEKDGSDKKMLKSTEENSQQIIERKNMNFGNSNTSLTKKENCKNQKTDKSTPKSKVSNELKKKASTYIPSSCETQASNTATNETNKDNFESKHIKNDVNLNKVKENCIEQEIMSTTKLVNYESKLAPKNKGSDEAIVDVNEIITVQTSTRRHTKGSASKSAYKGAQIPSLSLKDSMFLKSSSDSLCSSDDIETRHATRTVRKAERSKSKGLAKVFGFASGERNLKFVSSKKYQVNQSSKAKSKKSKPNNLSVLSSWDSNSSTSDSDSNMGHESGRFRNVHQIIQPFEVKPNHIKNGMLMAICGKQMYPVIKQVGSKRHYVKWKDDGTNEITIAKKCKGSKNKHKYLTNRGEHENNNYPVYLSTSSESDSNRNSYHKMPRYITKKKTSKCRCRSETCSTPADKWRNECLLEKQRNDKLMGLLDQLLELKSGKSSLEKGQVPEDVKHSQSTMPDVQEPDQIDLTQTDPTQDNVLKISASYGNKVIQLEVKNDDITNPLKKVLEALNVDDKNETDAVQENQQEVIERKEVQTRVDKLEETIFNAIIELDKREEIVTPIDEEMQVVENKKTEVNLSSGSRSAVNDNNVDVSTIIEEAKIDSSKRVSKKRRGEDRSTVETHKLKKAPRSRKKDAISTTTTQENEVTTITLPTVKESETTTITLPTVQESETTTITLPTVQESETTAITLPTVQESETTTITLPTVQESQTTTITRQESDISTASKADKKKKTKRSRQHLDKSVLEDNDLSKGVSKVENVVGKETAVEHKKHVTESMPRVNSGNDLALDVSDQEIFFTKESLSKRSSIELKSPRRLRSGQQDTSASIKSEDSATSLLQSLRTRSRDHNEKKNESNRSFYPTRSQNKLMNRKKVLHILQDRLSSVRNSRFTSPESAHSYVDSDLSPVLRSFHNKQKSKRKFRVTKKISIAHDLLPRSIRRSRQSNEFKKQLDLSKPSSHSVQKTIDTSAKSTSYHTTPTSKLSVNSKRVFENIPVICVNQLTSSKGTESHSTSVTETVVATAQNSNFENTPNSTGRLTPRGPDTSRSELPVSPEISFIEKITVSLNRLNPESNDLPCRSDHLTINTLDKSHPLLDQDVSFDDAKDKDWKQNENIDDSNVNNSQHSDQSSLQDSRGYASLISESLISGISNVNLSNKLSQTLEMEFTNLSLEKLQNKIHLDTCTSKEKRVTKKDKSNTKPNSSKTTRKSNWTGDDELFDIVGYNSNDENAVHTGKGKRGKKQYVKVKIVRPKHKSKNSSKISNISDNANNDYESSQNLGVPTTNISDLSVEEIVTDPQPVIVVDNDDSVLTPANTSLQLALGAEEDSCVNLTMSMQSEGKFSDILTNDELTMSPVQDTPITWYLLSDDESLDAHAYRDRSCRGSLFVLTLPSCLSARRDLDLTAITEDSNDNNARN